MCPVYPAIARNRGDASLNAFHKEGPHDTPTVPHDDGLVRRGRTHGCSSVLSRKPWEMRKRVIGEGNDQASSPRTMHGWEMLRGFGMRTSVVWVGWMVGLTLVAACSTTSQDNAKTRPRAHVIGHGTTPGSSWAGVGISIPFPGKSSTPAPSSSEQDSKESGQP